jgi:hypothetical protein
MLGDDCDDCDAIFTTFRVNSEEFESKVARRTGQHYIGLTQGSTGVHTRGTDVLFSSCRPEAGQIQIGSADRDRRPFTGRAVGRRYRRPFGALVGRSDLNRVGTARDAVADRAAGPASGRLVFPAAPLFPAALAISRRSPYPTQPKTSTPSSCAGSARRSLPSPTALGQA